MKILVINAGSSSLKYQLIDVESGDVIAKGLCERIGIENSKLTYKPAGKEPFELVQDMKDHTDAIKLVLDALVDEKHGVISDMSEIDAVGHRVVHGGEKFAESVLLTDEVLETIESCTTRQISWASAHARQSCPTLQWSAFSTLRSIKQCPRKLSSTVFPMRHTPKTWFAATVSTALPTTM